MTSAARLGTAVVFVGLALGLVFATRRASPPRTSPPEATPPAAAPSGPRATLTGRVLDRDSRPLSAEVTVFRPRDDDLDPMGRTAERFGFFGRHQEALAKQATGADGSFSFADLPLGEYLVRADAPEHVLTVETVRLEAGGPARTLTLVPGEGAPLDGRVVDEAGAGVPGARLSFQAAGDHASPYERVFATADAKGRFRVFVEGPVFAMATADGYAPTFAGTSLPSGEARAVVVLRRGGRLEVTVVDRDSDAPVAGAQVQAMVAPAPGDPGGRGGGSFLFGTTDLRGRCDFDSAPGIVHHFSVSHPRYAGAVQARDGIGWSDVSAAVEGDTARPIGPGTTSRLRVRLAKGLTLHGRVLAADGTPVPGAKVRTDFRRHALKAMGSPSALYPLRSDVSAVADADGRYRLESLRPEDLETIVVEAIGWRREPEEEEPIPPAPTGELAHDLRVVPAPILRGRVVDGEGRPVAGARVSLVGGGPEAPTAASTTGEDGSYVLSVGTGTATFRRRPGRPEPRPPGESAVRVEAEGFLDATSPVLVLGSSTEVPVVLLSRSTVVSGRVVDPDGRPVGNAMVEAFPAGRPRDPWFGRHLRTTGSGFFEFTALPEGRVTLEASADGFAETRQTVAAAAATPARDVVVRLRPAGVVRGTVLDPEGNPVRRAKVRLSGRLAGKEGDEAHAGRYVTVTDEEGAFELHRLAAGERATIRVSAEGMRPASEVLEGGGPPHEFRLQRVATAPAARRAEIDAEVADLERESEASDDVREIEDLGKEIARLRQERSRLSGR